jgi:hypothetical protein
MIRLMKSRGRFSTPQLTIFAVAFALIGYLIFRSFALNPNLPGDLNNDNTVNITDMSILLSNYGTSNPTADINSDGTVNILDMSILLSNYGKSDVASPIYVSSNIAAGQTLSGTVNWTVTTSGAVSAVEFWTNTTKLSTVTTSNNNVWSYSLDTTKLADGSQHLGLAIDGADGSRQTPQIGYVTIRNGATTGKLYYHWDFNADPATVRDSVSGASPFNEQCASTSSARNSGGTTTSPLTPDRATSVQLGGVNWARLRTMPGDSYITGSGTRYRCDLVTGSGVSSHTANGEITAYRQRVLIRPGVDFNPTVGVGTTVFFGFHRNTGGYPGGSVWASYANATSDTGNGSEYNQSNLTSGTSPFQSGTVFLEMFGGQYVDRSGNPVNQNANPSITPYSLNNEDWPILPPGLNWPGKAVDLAWRIKWSANRTDYGTKFYKDINGGTGKPSDYNDSGWIELQFRIGTIGSSSITWGGWQWYDGGTMKFADGGQQVWQNGPVAHRHYRPTLFYYNYTNTYDTPYLKGGHYYHEADNLDSSVYVGDDMIGDSFSAVGAPN